MAFIDIGFPHGPFSNCNGISVDSSCNYFTLNANRSAVGIISLTSIRLTLSCNNFSSIDYIFLSNQNPYFSVDSSLPISSIITMNFPEPIFWADIQNSYYGPDLYVQIANDYEPMTVVKVEGEGTGAIFGGQTYWTSFIGTIEV